MFSAKGTCRILQFFTILIGICSISVLSDHLGLNEKSTKDDMSDAETGNSSEIESSHEDISKDTDTSEMPELELNVDDCGSKHGVVTRLVLNPPCEGEGRPCVLRRDVEYYLNGTILPRIFAKNVTLQINQVDPNFGFDTQLHPPRNACGRYGVECPLEADIPIDILYTGRFPPSVPPFKVIARIILYGDDQAVLVCKQLPLQII